MRYSRLKGGTTAHTHDRPHARTRPRRTVESHAGSMAVTPRMYGREVSTISRKVTHSGGSLNSTDDGWM